MHREAMMIVRADLCQRLKALERQAERGERVAFAATLRSMRDIGDAYGCAPVVSIVDAIGRLPMGAGHHRSAALYLDRLHDAIACDRLDERASEALLASVSVHLRP